MNGMSERHRGLDQEVDEFGHGQSQKSKNAPDNAASREVLAFDR
jgi:hypothetical protein